MYAKSKDLKNRYKVYRDFFFVVVNQRERENSPETTNFCAANSNRRRQKLVGITIDPKSFFFSLAVGPLFTCEPNRQQIHRSDRQLERKSEKGKDQSAKRFFFFLLSNFSFCRFRYWNSTREMLEPVIGQYQVSEQHFCLQTTFARLWRKIVSNGRVMASIRRWKDIW